MRCIRKGNESGERRPEYNELMECDKNSVAFDKNPQEPNTLTAKFVVFGEDQIVLP